MASLDELNPGVLMTGSFTCLDCSEVVTEARWDTGKGKLAWLCSNGHRSEVSFK